MRGSREHRGRSRAWSATALVALAAAAPAALPAVAAAAGPPIALVHVSDDPLSGGGAQHATEVESASATAGKKVVGVYQVARFDLGGSAAAAGFATSRDGGRTWRHGLLGGLTGATPAHPGPHARVVDENVAYDAAHRKWLIGSVAVDPVGGSFNEVAAFVSRSSDGLSWSAPVTAVGANAPDKQWTACDDSASSPHYGTCYMAYTAQAIGSGPVQVVRSGDGGATWSAPVDTGIASGYNAQPVVQPDGTLIVVTTDRAESALLAARSTDGGASFGAPVAITPMQHRKPGGVRVFFKPSVARTAGGKVWVTWADCRFHPGCTANDVVTTTTTNGFAWSPVRRVPIDPPASGVDHVIPVLAVEPRTGTVGIHYDEIANTPCGAAGQRACAIQSVFVSSSDGGAHWSPRSRLAPASLAFNFPTTPQGFMPGDYDGLSYAGGIAVALFPIAGPRSGSKYDVGMNAALVPAELVTLRGPTTLRVRHGRFTVKLAFAATAPPGRAKLRAVYKRARIGSARVRVKRGRTVKATVPLTGAGRSKLARAHRLKVSLRISLAGRTTAQQLTLRG